MRASSFGLSLFGFVALLLVAGGAAGVSPSPAVAARFPPPASPGAGPLAKRTAPTPKGAAYYVAPSGGGTACTKAAPCRQISDATARLRPGDVLFIADGTYATFRLDGVKGGENAPITLYADGTGATVGAGKQDSITVYDSSNVVLDGLNAAGGTRAGVGVICSDHIVVRNGRFRDNAWWGVFSGFADDLVVEHNETSGSKAQHGIYASNSADRPIIRSNLSHDNAGCGVQINADHNMAPESGCSFRGAVDGVTTGAVIEGNVIYLNGKSGGAAINLDGVQDSIVRNNILFDNAAGGMTNYRQDGADGPRGMEIIGNTLVQPHGARQGLQFVATSGKNLLRDNILLHTDDSRAGLEFGSPADVANVDSDYNVVDRVIVDSAGEPVKLDKFQVMYGDDKHSTVGGSREHVFANPGLYDAILSAKSPALGKGVFMSDAPTDHAGKLRPTSAPDVGALQH